MGLAGRNHRMGSDIHLDETSHERIAKRNRFLWPDCSRGRWGLWAGWGGSPWAVDRVVKSESGP